jgi:hypothetical protein
VLFAIIDNCTIDTVSALFLTNRKLGADIGSAGDSEVWERLLLREYPIAAGLREKLREVGGTVPPCVEMLTMLGRQMQLPRAPVWPANTPLFSDVLISLRFGAVKPWQVAPGITLPPSTAPGPYTMVCDAEYAAEKRAFEISPSGDATFEYLFMQQVGDLLQPGISAIDHSQLPIVERGCSLEVLVTDKVSGAMAYIDTSAMQTSGPNRILSDDNDWFGRDDEYDDELERHGDDPLRWVIGHLEATKSMGAGEVCSEDIVIYASVWPASDGITNDAEANDNSLISHPAILTFGVRFATERGIVDDATGISGPLGLRTPIGHEFSVFELHGTSPAQAWLDSLSCV